ncbi:MAG: glycerol-3-phosphate dehydrogenase [Woeseia sp.]|nr:glycerol-3-phosphate dehydrogenase [Woeseia sp.]MBT8097830.1 glycerol-3-phosphate dehydrogenase [Woeseia sp.]NNE60584.1 glycerol-3-phosphate dehydrogenase [Woeseia sp.]NNL54861.1 glycerol-3-phosphate dehydrogenase [Woeseia sp.]
MPEQVGEFDVIVIGGGINGAGIARDAALRGLRVLLLEANDFGGGTSSWSSRLIHGGLRYLEYGEIPLVYESLHERATLQKIAPHLVRPLRLVIPLYRDGHRARWLVRIGMLAYDLLSIGKSLPNHQMLSADELAQLATAINRDNLVGAASYFDAQVSFAERLVLENVLSAAAAGATVRNYSPVTELQLSSRGEHVVQFTDGRDGPLHEARSPCVVNAAGPWVDQVLSQSDQDVPRLMGGTKGSHIVINTFAGGPQDALYVEAASDGRPVFMIPWNGQYLIGTTDLRYDGDARDARASIEEVEYLLETVKKLFPDSRIGRKSVNYTYSGVRPLPYVAKGPEGAITRAHIIYRHEATGVFSIIGGKLTTYRNLAEQVVDKLQKALNRRDQSCVTARQPLPGGASLAAAEPIDFPELSDSGQRRLRDLYGSRVSRLAEFCKNDPALARVIDNRNEVLAAEVVMALREEFARTLVDIMHRRLMIGLAADQGQSAALAVAAVAAEESGWDESRVEAEMTALARYNLRLREPATSD